MLLAGAAAQDDARDNRDCGNQADADDGHHGVVARLGQTAVGLNRRTGALGLTGLSRLLGVPGLLGLPGLVVLAGVGTRVGIGFLVKAKRGRYERPLP